jgi:thioredoxin reductase (NADPH)
MTDVIIIGSGPAGVSLALYLKRSNYNVKVFTTNNSTLKKAGEIENYYGIGKISGDELYEIGIKQLKELEIPVLNEEVVKLEKTNSFNVYTSSGTYEAKVVVLATGILRTPSKISNLSNYEGKGVSYCATCDGFFFRNKKIGLVGTGNLAHEEAKHLKKISDDVTLFTNGEELKRDFSDLNINIIDRKIDKIIGDERVEGISFGDRDICDIDCLFIAVGMATASTFSKTLGIAMNNNFIMVNDSYMTNIEGLYAVGDVIGGTLQIGKAVADGIVASKEIDKFLKVKTS